jgi:prevent-host-death family protein
MKEISVTEFKAHCTQIIREVADTPYTVTKRGKPIAIITPAKAKDGGKPKTMEEYMGCLRGSSVQVGDIISPVDEAWDACK